MSSLEGLHGLRLSLFSWKAFKPSGEADSCRRCFSASSPPRRRLLLPPRVGMKFTPTREGKESVTIEGLGSWEQSLIHYSFNKHVLSSSCGSAP